MKRTKKILREVVEYAVIIAVAAGIALLLNRFVIERTVVEGHSMENALEDQDQLFVDKISYRFRKPKRYEIVVFPYQPGEDTYYIKRIVGLPGETVQVIDGYLYIDGEVATDDVYGKEVMENAGIAEKPITLGDDEYFLLGDNRNHSADSRQADVGVVKGSDFVGRAWVRIWPLDKLGVIRHE